MKKALMLLFSVDNFTLDVLDEMTSEERFETAKKGVENGNADIYILGEFCGEINNGFDTLTEYYVYPHYVEEEEYWKWAK